MTKVIRRAASVLEDVWDALYDPTLLLLVAAFCVLVLGVASAAASPRGDDPGPVLRYGGTPIELHFSAPGANVTKVYVDGTPCVIVSDADEYGDQDHKTIALSCDWGER